MGYNNQYVQFTKIYNAQMKKYGRSQEAIQETIRICKDEDVLKEYLSKHEQEVRDIMFSLFDEEYIFDVYTRSILKKGRAEGIQKGRAEGIQTGLAQGIIQAAKRLLKSGMPADKVAEVLEIPKKDVEGL